MPSNLKSISQRQLKGHNNIYLLNDFSVTKGIRLFKYMCFDQFVNGIAEKELVFVSPAKWKDPFERRFFKTDYTSLKYIRPDIACMCLTSKSATNEEASWKMYANSGDKVLRLTFEFTELCKILDNYADANGCKIYLGNAIYDFTKDEIESLHKKTHRKLSNPNYSVFFNTPFTMAHYLSIMSIKRAAFRFENEVRIFIVKNSLTFDNGLLRLKNITFSKKLISKIMIGPYEPLPEYDIKSPIIKKLHEIETKEFKTILGSMISCVVHQSGLYENCNPLLKV